MSPQKVVVSLLIFKRLFVCASGVQKATFFRPYLKNTPRQRLLELESIVCSVENLNTFPVVAELTSIGELKLYGAWFDISSGELLTYSLESRTWSKVD